MKEDLKLRTYVGKWTVTVNVNPEKRALIQEIYRNYMNGDLVIEIEETGKVKGEAK